MDEKKAEDPSLAQDIPEKQEKFLQNAEATTILRDGIAVFPKPTSDPLDPLNWTSFRKHSILAIACLKYFLFTYITTTT